MNFRNYDKNSSNMAALVRRLKLEGVVEVVRQFPVSCFLLGSLITVTVVLHRYLPLFLLLWSFIAGLVSFFFALSPDSLFPSVLIGCRPPHTTQEEAELFPSGLSCAVCGKNKCKRHRPTLRVENYQPWLDLKIHSKVDSSIAEVFELVLENFVFPWYKEISDDEDCLEEIRRTFRFFASVLIRRAQKVDFPAVFVEKVMKAAMKHVEIVRNARDTGGDLQSSALGEYGSQLHVALHSRSQELHYLRSLTNLLFPYLLPPKATDCRSLALLLREVMCGSVFLPIIDFMADPDTVNLMVLLFVDDTPPEQWSEPPSPLITFLHRYENASTEEKKKSVLKVELSQIREQQDLLFRFMNFLKQEGAVHVLQFCLTVEEFNDRVLQPELSETQLFSLHADVQNIYQTYCLDESIDKINFDPEIIRDIQRVAAAPPCDVIRLQKMTCLFEAYEHVLSLLENVFTPMFCHSDEYFRHLLRGVESPARNSRINRNLSRRGETSGISRIGSKIKGVFKSNALEGAMLPPSATAELEDDLVEEATMVQEGDFLCEPQSWSGPGPDPGLGSGSGRNLSEWKVWIPFIDVLEDEQRKDRVPAFLIQVQREDRRSVGHEPESWVVLRRYVEFYVLESKLTEFHGQFADVQLPSKRILGPKNFEFLETKRPEFEEYLQSLLVVPELSNSQLVADFLSPHNDSQFTDKILPDVNLGKIFKSVPGKLMKEKGQNLEPFLQSFFLSCESSKPKPSKNEVTVLSPTGHAHKKLFSSPYRNNADFVDVTDRKSHNYFLQQLQLHGLYDCFLFLARVAFRVSAPVHHFLVAVRMVAKRSLEAWLERLMRLKLQQNLQENRLVCLITQLRDAVFCEDSPDRSELDKLSRAKKTYEEMNKYLPDFLVKIMGEESKSEGIKLLFDMIQQPLLNKQMTYVLLDVLVLELFPELNKSSGAQTFIV